MVPCTRSSTWSNTASASTGTSLLAGSTSGARRVAADSATVKSATCWCNGLLYAPEERSRIGRQIRSMANYLRPIVNAVDVSLYEIVAWPDGVN